MRDTAPASIPTDSELPAGAIEAIAQALQGLRYGQVTVTVQDGRVMQVDRTDRFRLSGESGSSNKRDGDSRRERGES